MKYRQTLLIIVALLVPGLAFSGSIKGKIIYSAEVKLPKTISTGKYKKACGPEVPNEKLLVNDKGLMNVVVSLDGKKLGGESGEYLLDQKHCRYEPHVIAMMKDSELHIRSSDPINHNLHSYSFDNDPVNIMFLPNKDDYTQEFEEPEIVKVECDLHGWMNAWIVVTDNSYFDISKKDGNFEIKNVPPGKYTLNAWHEVLGSKSQKIKVGEGVTEVTFDFSDVLPQAEQE
jgi:polysaccharide lyase family 4-like protein